ncbi:hypothetical protein HZA86_02840 [Candidatus Uhrbacteria bacterium]|nr:hypothetical protein [Candidatus Uhrbacteria bacterium]
MKNSLRIGVAALMAVALLVSAGVSAASDSSVSTTGTDEFVQAKALIDQGVSCSQLSTDQLERLGDYYMEQMMPGPAHKNMEQILGGEGSESLKQMHILMARRWYCGDAVGMGMMGMMGGVYGPGMMGGNIGSSTASPYGMMGRGWSGSYGMMGAGYGWGGGLVSVLVIILLIAGIAASLKYLFKK